MRILQITPGYYPQFGGVERHVQAISEQLRALGHQVVVAAAVPEKGPGSYDDSGDVEVWRFGTVGLGPTYRVSLQLWSHLRTVQDSFDIMHVHNYHTAVVPIAAALGHRCLVVSTHLNDRPHSTLAQLLHRPYLAVGRWSLSRAACVLCDSEAERDRVIARLGVSPDRMMVMPHGVDSRLRPHVGPAPARIPHLLLCVGRLEAYKRVDLVITALPRLPEEYRLVIIGDGPERASLQRLAVSRRVDDRVAFFGSVSDEELSLWYQRASVLVTLSSAEAFGLTVLEAISAGCPVVCSPIPAFTELAHRFPSWISPVTAKGEAALVDGIKEADYRQRPERPDTTSFSWEPQVRRLVDLYNELVIASTEAAPSVAAQV